MQPTVNLALNQFAALTDLTRVRVVRLLSVTGESASLTALSLALGTELSLLSKHVGVLAAASMVVSRRHGRALQISMPPGAGGGGFLRAAVLDIDDSGGVFASDFERFTAQNGTIELYVNE